MTSVLGERGGRRETASVLGDAPAVPAAVGRRHSVDVAVGDPQPPIRIALGDRRTDAERVRAALGDRVYVRRQLRAALGDGWPQ